MISDGLFLPWDSRDSTGITLGGGIDYEGFVVTITCTVSHTIKISQADLVRNPEVIVDRVRDFDLARAGVEMDKVRKRFVYDMGRDWYQGAWGIMVKQLELKLDNIH